MGFGFSFGDNTSNSKSTTTGNSTTTGTQSGTTNQSQSQNQSQTTTQSGSTASQGSSTTSQSGSTSQTGTTSQQEQQTSQLLGDTVLDPLSALVTKLIGTGDSSAASKAQGAGLNYIGDFNPDQFVAQTLAAAKSNSDINVKQTIGGIFDAIGGKNNSAATLLSQQVHDQADATLAGIGAQAQQTAAGIVNAGVNTATSAAQATNSFLENLVNTLKGATATSAASTAGSSASDQTSAQTGTTDTAEAGTSQSTSQQDTVSSLVSVLSQLMNSVSNTNATQTTVGSDSKSGGGISFS